MDLLEHNRLAWNHEAQAGNRWTIPVTQAELEAASRGEYRLLLTPLTPIPAAWLGDVRAKQVLCLASGGGQQGPLLAAAGAQVTVFDNSDEQLQRDSQLAETHHLPLKVVQGNMQDLGCFADRSFDLIIHPVSNCFIDDILPVWRESYRVLRVPGSLLAGFTSPLIYMLDWDEAERTRRCLIRKSIPYSDLRSLSDEMKQKFIEEKKPFEFGHSLTDQIQGQIAAGFQIAGFYEDKDGESPLDEYTGSFIATRAVKI